MEAPHTDLAISPWVRRWSHLVPANAEVLDVACGSGRHVRWFAQRGSRVTALDRDGAAVEPLRAIAQVVVADIEGAAWPLPGRRFDAVVCTNYLWRPLLPTLLDAVADDGVLLYETFAVGNETIGRPSNPNFLLRRAELLAAVGALRVIGYEDGFIDAPARFVQRVVAVREGPAQALPRRWRLPAD
jgi:SAM-dependent methyltransferase